MKEGLGGVENKVAKANSKSGMTIHPKIQLASLSTKFYKKCNTKKETYGKSVT
jgi:hypothetical protein